MPDVHNRSLGRSRAMIVNLTRLIGAFGVVAMAGGLHSVWI
ncbi:MAG: hypothetical protein QOH05_4761 [Acetobacteraceae bacterium]|nr:hypothetical protein [Acetobacteraceae bacterium]